MARMDQWRLILIVRYWYNIKFSPVTKETLINVVQHTVHQNYYYYGNEMHLTSPSSPLPGVFQEDLTKHNTFTNIASNC